MSENNEQVREDLFELSMDAAENDKDPRFTAHPYLTFVGCIVLGALTAIVLSPVLILDRIYSTRFTSWSTAIVVSIFVVGFAAPMTDFVGEMGDSMREGMAEMEEMEDPAFIGCEACGVAPIEMVDRAVTKPGDPLDDCPACGVQLTWDGVVEPADGAEKTNRGEDDGTV
jgi:hypothetical protein